MWEDRHDNHVHRNASICNLTFKKLNTILQYKNHHHNK